MSRNKINLLNAHDTKRTNKIRGNERPRDHALALEKHALVLSINEYIQKCQVTYPFLLYAFLNASDYVR